MKFSFANFFLMIGSLSLGLVPLRASSETLVELFTSEGCSACVSADMLMNEYAKNPDIIPVSYHIDYWDYLGWADTLARPEFSMRQIAYQQARQEKQVFTPQVIVAGNQGFSGSDGIAITKGIARVKSDAVIKMDIRHSNNNTNLRFTQDESMAMMHQIMLAYLIPVTTVEIGAGENSGHKMTYTNTVVKLIKLADWDGSSAIEVNFVPENDLSNVVFIQEENMGKIIFAKKIDK